MKRILSLCDYTGRWSDPYKLNGYEVIQVDIQHGQDVRLLEHPGSIYGIIAQPPCTHLAGSGARWWKSKGEEKLLEALQIVDACLRFVAICNPEFWVLENPVGRLSRYLGKPVFTYNPHEFAGYADDPNSEAYTKRTCLWGKFNRPKLKPVPATLGSMMHLLPPSADRADKRSITPVGFSRAFYEANR